MIWSLFGAQVGEDFGQGAEHSALSLRLISLDEC
jgi:hypothetical protein